MRMGRIFKKGLLMLAGIALLAVAGGAFYFFQYLPATVAPRSFPTVEGNILAAGLDDQVIVYRDEMGVAHIYAQTQHDLFFAQGFVHAQERFWQMDTWRHIGAGRLAEMFGESQVETDAFLRTLGWEQTAEAEWTALGQEARAILQAYSQGVNAYLKDHSGDALSLEYALLKLLNPGYRIEAWTPVNSLTWGKAMAWDLRGNIDEEIERAVLLKTLTAEQVDELFPAYPADHPVIVKILEDAEAAAVDPSQTTAYSVPELLLDQLAKNLALLDPLLGAWGDGIGSNSWVVSGNLTTSGKPLLANDPHLSIQMPSIWFQVGMHCQPKTEECPYEMAGFSFAGVPGVVIGHNDRITWGFTNAGPDVMDLYIEKVNPQNPDQYEVNGKWVDFETREETIQISGAESMTLKVRSTRHGPVVSDTFAPLMDRGNPEDRDFIPFRERTGIELPEKYVIALRWTALSPSTPFEAVWGFDKAQNWKEFREAAKKFYVPSQNLIYADVEGNIGYQMPGKIPLRAAGDGHLPVPGWTDEYEWLGYIPFEELPSSFNPEEGFLVTANNQTHPRDYAHFISSDWDYGFRAQRIVEMLNSTGGGFDAGVFQEMQGDAFDSNGEFFIPILAQTLGDDLTKTEAAALDVLQHWDFQANADSAAAAIFEVFWRQLLQNTFHDDLPEAYWPEGGSRWNQVMRGLAPDCFWWDDAATRDRVETRVDIFKKSFQGAVQELSKLQGKQAAEWCWGALHTATFRNQTLGESGIGLIERLFNRGPYQVSGGEAIVNATGWTATEGYQVDWLPSMRMIVDLSDLNASLSVHTTGQSGHAYHPHYDDMVLLWEDIQYYPMWWELEAIEQNAESRVVLMP